MTGQDARREVGVLVNSKYPRRKQDAAKFDLEKLATATEGFGGAEIEQAVTSAL